MEVGFHRLSLKMEALPQSDLLEVWVLQAWDLY